MGRPAGRDVQPRDDAVILGSARLSATKLFVRLMQSVRRIYADDEEAVVHTLKIQSSQAFFILPVLGSRHSLAMLLLRLSRQSRLESFSCCASVAETVAFA